MLPSGRKDRLLRYKYIHIWSSQEELRVKSTDPAVLEYLIRASKSKYWDGEFERYQDVSEQPHIFRIKGLETGEEEENDDQGEKKNIYLGLAWWMFRMLCDLGWEPMETGEYWYKLKYEETFSKLDL